MVSSVMILMFIALRIWDPVALQTLRLKGFDFYQSAHPREPSNQPVAIIDIDEESLAAYGQWPWPRTIIAKLVTKLMEAGVVVVGFDVVFAEPDRTSPANVAKVVPGLDEATRAILNKMPSNDSVLADTLKRSRVVLGQSTTSQPSAAMAERKTVTSSVGVKGVKGVNPMDYVFGFIGLTRNLGELEENASGIGLFTIQPEIDGVVRRVPVVGRVGKKLYPTLVIEMLRVALGRRSILLVGNAFGVYGVKLTKNLLIPTDQNGRTWINFSPHDQGRYISAKDVLEGDLPPGRLAGHLVLVGTSAVGLLDIRATPVDPAMPGVEIHAQLLETILDDIGRQGIRTAIDSLMKAPEEQRDMVKIEQFRDQLAMREALGPTYLEWPNYAIYAELAALLSLCLLMALMAIYVGAVWSMFAGGATVALFMGTSWYLYVEKGILLDVVSAGIAGFLIYSVLTYLNYVREGNEKRQVRSAFAQYMSPALVEQLAENPDQLQLGGEMRDMTLLFCDVRGFTSISELYKSDPQGLTSLINRFLTPTTNDILARRGTIDKYMGDCIMAFWNAPLDDEDHAANACESALAMMISVAELNVVLEAEAEETGLRFIPIKVGIGINSGECCVGNMGSEQRFDYSVLGDPVNLAARLEGQSKNYAVDIVIGENTLKKAEHFATVELDLIKVKGKDEAVRIYTLLGDTEMRENADFLTLAGRHGDMLAAYRSQKWDEARGAIADCRKINGPLDKFYDLYEERMSVFEEVPPDADWDGVYVATTK